MNKFINFMILYASLLLGETISSFLIVLVYFSFEELDLKGSLDAAFLWNVWRLIFHGLPFTMLYFLIFKYIENINLEKPLLFSIFNLLVYISLSVLSRMIWGNNVPLSPTVMMFWITCVSIIICPIILGKIPYFKKIMENL
ncbi:hypothetical protein [Siphonobacter sp. SORGH_AS_0500]|uniref:hypothetical protein n=1 Tax=Siphonobacter sp. SORGH_AS_0500 TaxID=1864824 RepID=UPI0028569C4D|nr:hypothetical protein [Siphonobacter sp. SORGH_AS_0500]MDR6198023.1 hypothetical protein [Siphonobacter sp. SORGH_AS_0500]